MSALGTGLWDLSGGEGELQPWPRALSPPGLGRADTQGSSRQDCARPVPTPRVLPALLSHCPVGTLGAAASPGSAGVPTATGSPSWQLLQLGICRAVSWEGL